MLWEWVLFIEIFRVVYTWDENTQAERTFIFTVKQKAGRSDARIISTKTRKESTTASRVNFATLEFWAHASGLRSSRNTRSFQSGRNGG